MIERLTQTEGVVVAAHRGYKSKYPENTLLAFAEAAALGVDMLELDLRLSKDKQLMVIHDETVDRTTNGSGLVSEWEAAELQELDAGGWFGARFAGLKIPLFSELCAFIEGYPNMLLNVEIKPAPDALEAADLAVAALEACGMRENCVFTSFDAVVLAHLYRHHGVRTQGFPGEVMHHFAAGEDGTYAAMWAAGISMKLLTPERVAEFRARGILPWCYCPDDEEQVRHAIACGATLLTCNDPLPALRLRERLQAG
ncbi:glycerophosphodiester phosphodiesterase family protein [Paenibacillus sp. 1P07SE]|uniref:glycerophosphodiester phosphodiesterase family protein n=1 Tax=Paenibacillus sp. 1P07SE TaxID=3132209 RepID=UPI0039A41688